MEVETVPLPESSPDFSQPPPNFPKPDFTEIENDFPSDKPDAPLSKPTFKSALQAKKRLQAFSSTRPSSLPASPKKEKSDEGKKPPKKGHYHDDKAKAVIEEIEELKREEQAYLEMQRQASKRSRSRTPERGRFKKVEKKARNYRRRSRSATPEKPPKKVAKKAKKYPKNWREFNEFEATFELNRDFEIASPGGNNELLRQLLFETPSLPIVAFKMKTVEREDKIIPFEYIRYTKSKPIVAYSVNCATIKPVYLSRKTILESLPKDIVANIENLYSNSLTFKENVQDPKVARSWYPKQWKESENECKVLENSVGLSFLQTYVGEEEENEEPESKPDESVKKKKKKKKSVEKKTKKRVKDSVEKKKKRKKDKTKKREKDKHKHKKVKEKKKKKSENEEEKSVKPSKQQVIDELKKIDEKLAKKREEKEEKPEKSRKRKQSETEEDAKRPKHEKNKSEEHALKIKLEKQKEMERQKPRKKKSRWSEDANEEKSKKDEEKSKDATPDTDEYHSHWESDDDVSSSVPRQSLKVNRSWESDEELFERSHNRNKTQNDNYTNLEIPLNIKNFARRSNWDDKPLSVVDELKLLEEERKTLSEERRQLELEKQKILKLQEEVVKIDVEEKKIVTDDVKSCTPEQGIKVKKTKLDLDFNIDSLNSSLLSNVSSTESSFPVAVLENEYEEFIKAVSTETVLPIKKKTERRSSSSSSSSSDSDHKKKKRKKKKKKKKRECEGLLLGKHNDIFNEFDIPVPSDLPEMVPTPVPVPSPIVPVDLILPLTTPILLNPVAEKQEEEPTPESGLDLTKPFVFPSIILPKKPPLVDNSNLNLNDDSDSADFTDKFVKKPEEQEEKPPELEVKIEPEPVVEEIKDVPLPQVESEPPKLAPEPPKRSPTPPRKKEKRRSRSRSPKRRSPPRRITPPSRRRRPSPRRRTPPRRRRSPSPRRRSPPRRRRRSPSISPPRSRGGARKRTPSPRIRRASPLNSPLDGFKRSVADSTISDDMLPQPNPDDYVESPPSYVGGAKYFKRRGSASPQMSPRRISLDDRINQVLGLEKNEPPPQPKIHEPYPNYGYPNHAYGQQYPPYGQYGQKNDYMQPYGPVIYSQPPPTNVVKSVPATKVVQVGNILQVVPNDEIPPPVIENKTPERSQKIVQVGNMLQIVPASQIPEIPAQNNQIVEIPEQSAEASMKQKIAERKAEREKRRQERERRRKEKEKKRKEKEKRKQLKLKLKTENMIKRAIQLETEALANEIEEETENAETPVQWSVPVVVSATPTTNKGILLAQGASRQRKSVQFADGVRPGEGTSPSGGEELSSPPPNPCKLKEKRYKKLKIPKKTKKKKIKVKVVKRVQSLEEDDDDDEDDNLPPPPPPPGSPPPHVFPSRIKTHTINNVHQYVGNILQSSPAGYPFRPPIPVVLNRHQGPPSYMQGAFPTDVNSLSHQPFQGVSSHH
ncbi:titin-like [Tribolium madens]|uniref:titin-like n=1 Tax=Tribolium madens TaxID=41895 RepID=UPI001CF72AF2|nr:titin-like [Tribolium madens]XP_044272753.1 titin-like [Tribolium madens]